jgi:hypothetical protein
MIGFIGDQRQAYEVDPICQVLLTPHRPSTLIPLAGVTRIDPCLKWASRMYSVGDL